MPTLHVTIQLTSGTVADCLMQGECYQLMRQLAGNKGTHFGLGGYDTKGQRLAYIALRSDTSLLTIHEMEATPDEIATLTTQPSENNSRAPAARARRGRQEQSKDLIRGTDGVVAGEGNDKPDPSNP